MESAYKELLCKFSPTCRRILSESNRLFIPHGSRESVRFLYKWMVNGGEQRGLRDDSGLSFQELRVPDLLKLYEHSKHLEIHQLRQAVVSQLKWKLSHTLFLVVDQIDHFLHHVPETRTAVVSSTARLFLAPRSGLDYTLWTDYMTVNRSFARDFTRAIRLRLRRQAQKLNKFMRGQASKMVIGVMSTRNLIPAEASGDTAENLVAKGQPKNSRSERPPRCATRRPKRSRELSRSTQNASVTPETGPGASKAGPPPTVVTYHGEEAGPGAATSGSGLTMSRPQPRHSIVPRRRKPFRTPLQNTNSNNVMGEMNKGDMTVSDRTVSSHYSSQSQSLTGAQMRKGDSTMTH